MTKTLQKLFSFILLWGIIPAVETSAHPELDFSAEQLHELSAGIQQGTFRLTGRVLDENKNPAVGTMIVVQGSGRGVISDHNGNFNIDVTPADILEVSFLGYESQSIPVIGQTHLIIELIPKASEMEEVTVVAYGRQRKESIVGAINTLDARDLNVSTGQLSSSLAGKLAGIVVMQRTGEPGSGAEFWVRGLKTFGGSNSPLVLVDGIERSMDLVDVEDIQTFSILKDATATALYGVRGANGIILITTKRGKEGATKINVKAEFGITQPVRLPELANTKEWLDYYNELYRDAGNPPPFSDYDMDMYLTGKDPDLYPSVDWMKTIFKSLAKTGRINVNTTGGSEKVRYYIGVSYTTEGGIFNVADKKRYDANMRYDKFNFRSNIDVDLTKSTELGLSISTQYTTKNAPGIENIGSIYNSVMNTTPISTPTIFSDGSLARPEMGGSNPYNDLNHNGYARNNNLNAQSLLSLTQDFSELITEGLSANVKFAWDAENGHTLRRHINPPKYFTTGRDDEGNLILDDGGIAYNKYMSLSRGNWGWTTINLEAMLLYERLVALDHRVSGMFLYSVRNRTNMNPGDYIAAFPYKNMGIAGRFTYAFRDKYFAEYNFGYNGSENFAPGKRFGFFPSYAAGYMISNEPFWEPIREYVSQLKIRGSYGKIGSDQIGGSRRFAYNTTLNTGAEGWRYGTNSGGSGYTGISTNYPGNASVAWEEAIKTDIGIEIGFFNKIRIQADYFNEKREGIFILRESTPSVAGFIVKGQKIEPYVNLGRMKNRGFDASVEYDHAVNQDLFLSARANFTFNRNRNLYDDRPDPIWKYQSNAGFAHYQQFGFIAEGLFESEEDIATAARHGLGEVRPGDIKYRDINGDGVINQFDRVAIGYSSVPEINYGFGISIGYKGFDFSTFFAGTGHVTRIIGGSVFFGDSAPIQTTGQIYKDVALNRWTLDNQNPNAPYPRLSMNRVDNNYQESTFWQRDMSFLRMKNIELGYTIPRNISKKIGMSTMRVYVQGVNLLTFSKFKLWDPELGTNSGNMYPMMRTATIGLNMNF